MSTGHDKAVATPKIDLPVGAEPKLSNKERMAIPRQEMPQQSAEQRIHNFLEVPLGFDENTARIEALRCIKCKKPTCIDGCPVGINIPGFLTKIAEGDFAGGARILKEDNILPAVCGRVCPQEEQCEKVCTVGKKNAPVAIGRLERFLADWEREHDMVQPLIPGVPTGKKVAIVGGGPAGLTAAADLVRMGHKVVLYEALHKPGGVLVYGIPEFRLPKKIVEFEVRQLEKAGVELHNSVVIGQTFTMTELQEKFDAVFVATGAGLPYFMNLAGENLNGVYSANEYLTRVNLMKAYDSHADTPVAKSKNVAVVGGGNVAMDGARTAKRLGADNVYLVYRRTRKEMPARVEEVEHAEEEGIKFFFLHNPIRYEGDADGRVCKAICERMELGEPDASGRRRPVPTGEFVELEVDTVVVAIGNGPNPLIPRTTDGLATKKWGNIKAEKKSGRTSIRGVWAGGDIVLGAATVILAMGAGRVAAKSIDEYLKTGEWPEVTLDG
jgi:glutamate synthase (NADPH/NADH) small chain